MKCVYSTPELLKADLIRSRLQSEGIEAVLQNEGAALYGFGVPGPVMLEITVRDEDADRAASIIHRLERRSGKRRPPRS
jgi:hypothetical protein